MSTNHLAMRPSTRLFVTLLATLSIIAAQMAVFAPTSADAEDEAPGGGNGGTFDFSGYIDFIYPDGGTERHHFDVEDNPGQDVPLPPYEWHGDGDNEGPEFHLSCSATLTGTTATDTDSNDVTVTLGGFDIERSKNGTTQATCSDTDFVELDISKTDSTDGDVSPGDPFSYTISLRNIATGDDATTATDVTLVDVVPHQLSIEGWSATFNDADVASDTCTVDGQTVDCSVDDLGPEGADTFELTIDVQVRDDVSDCGPVTNTATGGASNAAPVSDSTEITIDCPEKGSITVAKAVDGLGDAPEGDFAFDLVCDGETIDSFELAAGESKDFEQLGGFVDCTVEETNDQNADATSWQITGDATGSGDGTETDSFDVDETESVTVTFTNTYDLPPAPAIEITKDAIPSATEVTVGELVEFDDGEKSLFIDLDEQETYTVDYEFTVTNPSDRTLIVTSLTDVFFDRSEPPVEVADQDLLDAFTDANDGNVLAPEDVVTFTVTFTLTEEDLDRGFLDNTVTVTAFDDQTEQPVSSSDDEVVGISEVEGEVFEPSINIEKTAVDGVSEDEEGNLIVTIEGEDGSATVTYEFVVTNTGDDDLTDLTLVDDKIGDLTDALTAALEDATLPVGEAVTVTADHEVTAADFDGITLTNVVEVVGVGVDSDATVDDSDDETVTLVEVQDTAEELPETGLNAAGLTGLGLLLAMIGAASLLLTSPRREEDAS